jgi:hypothetical protein
LDEGGYPRNKEGHTDDIASFYRLQFKSITDNQWWRDDPYENCENVLESNEKSFNKVRAVFESI